MKNLIKILLFVSVGVVFSQEKTYNFTENQILGITKEITDLQVKDSLNTKIINDLDSIIKELEESAQIDSVIIVNKDKTIADLEEKSKFGILCFFSEKVHHNFSGGFGSFLCNSYIENLPNPYQKS